MRRIATALVGMSLVVSAASLPVAAQDASSTPESAAGSFARTTARYFLPFGPDGLNPGLTTSRETTGSCTESSLANIGRDDAFFCFEEETSAILDPCFANPFGDRETGAVLACVADPFATEAVLLTTTGPLVQEKDDAAAADDAMAMPPVNGRDAGSKDAGQQVVPVPPAAGAVRAEDGIDPLDMPWAMELAGGERCTILTGATAVLAGMRINYGCEGGGSVLGDVDRSGPVWTVAFWDGASLDAETVEVASAWT